MDRPGVESSITFQLTSFNKLLAEFKRMKTEMFKPAMEFIMASYNDLSMDDLRLCIHNGIKGLYGDIIVFDVAVLGKWLTTYREDKRIAAVQFNPAPEKSNQFPRKDHRVSYKMPDRIRELLKRDIGYEYKAPEEKPKRINWKEKLPDLTDQEVQIYEYFDDLWNEQGCRLKVKTTDQIVEVEGQGDMTRGQFVHHAKKLIEQNK